MLIHLQISPRRTCRLCGFTMTISSRGHRLLIYILKIHTKTDGMGPFNKMIRKLAWNNFIEVLVTLSVETWDERETTF